MRRIVKRVNPQPRALSPCLTSLQRRGESCSKGSKVQIESRAIIDTETHTILTEGMVR